MLTGVAALRLCRWYDISSYLSEMKRGLTITSSTRARDEFMKQVYQEMLDAGTATSPGESSTSMGMSTEIVSGMNFSVDPCDNFYEFVCGDWLEQQKVPADKPVYIKSYDFARDLVTKQMADMYQDPKVSQDPDDELHGGRKQLADYFNACMDTERVDMLGATPMMPLLDKIGAISTLEDVQEMVAHLTYSASPVLLNLQVELDKDNRSRYEIRIKHTGMTLPDYSYYACPPRCPASSAGAGDGGVDWNMSAAKSGVDNAEWKKLNFEMLQKEYGALNALAGYSDEEAAAAADVRDSPCPLAPLPRMVRTFNHEPMHLSERLGMGQATMNTEALLASFYSQVRRPPPRVSTLDLRR